MPYFTKKELAMSLCSPALTFLWGVFHLFLDFPWLALGDFSEKGFLLLLFPGNGGFPLIGLAAALLGGVLPTVLTLRLKIHTEEYLIARLIIIVVIYLSNRFIGNLFIPGGTDSTLFILYMIFNIGAVLIQILKVQKEDTLPEERVVLIISDPILYWVIYYFAYYMEIWIG